MANSWFRMYAEFAHDAKVQMLSEVDQRRFVMLLCLRCSNGDVTLQDCEVAFQLRITDEEWRSTKTRLMEKNLINEHSQPTSWDKRQFVSDSSAARVARHRAKKKNTCNVTCNDDATKSNALDTDTDTDTEEEKNIKKKKSAPNDDDGFIQFWTRYPHKVGKAEAMKAFGKLQPDSTMLSEILAGLERYIASKPAWQEWKHPGPWLNQRRWEDQPTKTKPREYALDEWMAGAI